LGWQKSERTKYMNTPIIGEPEEQTKQTPKDQVEQQTAEEDESIFGGKKHYPIFPTGLFKFDFKG
jgi:hypothetical protein